MKKLLILIVLLCVGCLGHTPQPFHYVIGFSHQAEANKVIDIYIDKYFGEADKVAIDDSIKQWNYALNGMIKLNVVSYQFDMDPTELSLAVRRGSWLILKIDSSSYLVDDGAVVNNHSKKTLAFTNDIGGTRLWVVRDRIQNSWVAGVVLHEMGHLLGAEHGQSYLMQPSFHWEDYRCVDRQSAKLVAAYQLLPINRMNYCEYGNK